MARLSGRSVLSVTILAALVVLVASCAPPEPQVQEPVPQILSAELNNLQVARYEKLEIAVDLEANFGNPYDVRQIDLTVVFIAPDDREWVVPGFWDGQEAWRVRFTPSAVGEWRFRLQVRDLDGESKPYEGQFTCLPSDHHGWLQVGAWVDPAYSSHYLVHHDGMPFYGVGHCDAFDVMSYGWDEERGFTLFDRMAASGENMLVYWPIYSNPFFATTYDRYSVPDLKVIDMVVEDAARKGIYLVFTVWNHDLLRDETHSWSRSNMGDWATHNGFRELCSLSAFFIDDEAWRWQENLYRYIIARWGYSPAIGLWQTVSEIEGTNAGSRLNPWHGEVNAYFVEHDPYRHPTTASKAGDAWWPTGYAVMDVAQMHSYDSKNDAVGTGPLIADWTQKMWQAETKPNFIGEFGTSSERLHPELLHNAIWAGLANGAAITPMEWNDSGTWGRMDDEMLDHMAYLATFVADLPLVRLRPTPLDVKVEGHGLDVWGLLGEDGDLGFFWVQDVGQTDESTEPRVGVTAVIKELAEGTYAIRPYDTWRGVYLAEVRETTRQGALVITLPSFEHDLAVKLVAQ